MVEDIANKFESAITKGFINILILSILEDTPAHGYKIKKNYKKILILCISFYGLTTLNILSIIYWSPGLPRDIVIL